MPLVIPVIAGYVENAGDLAKRIKHRRRRTRQEMILANVMVSGIDHNRLALDDGGADRVGAFLILSPGNAGFERDMLRFRQKIRIAHRMQDETFATAQEHHAARPGELMVEVLHHRSGQIDQVAILADDNSQIGFVDPADLADAIVGHTEGGATLPGSLDEIRNDAARNTPVAEKLTIGATDRRHIGGRMIVFHSTSSPHLGSGSEPDKRAAYCRRSWRRASPVI